MESQRYLYLWTTAEFGTPLSETLCPERSAITPLNRRILHPAPHSKLLGINDIWALRLATLL
jgi:hypothetical protein